jgi:hypothetical protein
LGCQSHRAAEDYGENKKMKWFRLIPGFRAVMRGTTACVLAVVMVSGCGYTTRSLIADKYHTIYIPGFRNKINISGEATANNYRLYRPRLETDITSVVVQKFLTDGNLRIVKKREGADLALEGNLVDFRKEALTYARNDYVNEYRVTISVGIKLIAVSSDTVLFDEPSYAGSATYMLSGAQASSEAEAITATINDLGRRIVERTVDQW